MKISNQKEEDRNTAAVVVAAPTPRYRSPSPVPAKQPRQMLLRRHQLRRRPPSCVAGNPVVFAAASKTASTLLMMIAMMIAVFGGHHFPAVADAFTMAGGKRASFHYQQHQQEPSVSSQRSYNPYNPPSRSMPMVPSSRQASAAAVTTQLQMFPESFQHDIQHQQGELFASPASIFLSGGALDVVKNIAVVGLVLVGGLLALTFLVTNVLVPAAARQLEDNCRRDYPDLWEEYELKLRETGESLTQRPDLMQELGNKYQDLMMKDFEAKQKEVEDAKKQAAAGSSSATTTSAAPAQTSLPSDVVDAEVVDENKD